VKSLKELKVNEKYQGCMCPLSQRPCLGPLCGWFEPNQKACSILVLCSLLDELNANLEAASR